MHNHPILKRCTCSDCLAERSAMPCFVCGEAICSSADYQGDGVYICKECNKFSSAANLLLSVPSEEIKALLTFVEADLNGVQTLAADVWRADVWRADVKTVRSWLNTVIAKASGEPTP